MNDENLEGNKKPYFYLKTCLTCLTIAFLGGLLLIGSCWLWLYFHPLRPFKMDL